MQVSQSSFAARILSYAVVLGTISSCTSARSPEAPLPRYEGRDTELFNDSIEPAAVGLDLDQSYAPGRAPLFLERTQTADAVARVRLDSLTTKPDGPGELYELRLRTSEALIAKRANGEYTVSVRRGNDAQGILRSLGTQLVGRAFIGFFRTFQRADGEKEVHCHLTADTKEVRAAVEQAVAVGGIRR